MHDLKLFRTDIERVRLALHNRHADSALASLDEIQSLEEERRAKLTEVDSLKRERNESSAEVARRKRAGEDASDLIERGRATGDEISARDERVREIDEKLRGLVLEIPNLPDESVPLGAGEEDNVEIARWASLAPSTLKPSRTGSSARRWAAWTSSAAPRSRARDSMCSRARWRAWNGR